MSTHLRSSEQRARGELRIGAWIVSPDLNQIRRDAEVVRIEPKAMAVLLHLAARRGEVASRDELLAAAWPGVVVGDNALTQVVIKLRKALGDTAREPAYIQAISKKGYRLVAPVAEVTAAGGLAPVGAPGPPASRRSRPWRWAGAAAAAVAAIVAGIGMIRSAADEHETGGAPSPPATARLSALPTVTVKPFEATGNDAQELLFARGITADLITDLSKLSGIWVASALPGERPRRDAAGSPPQYLLAGSVQRGGSRLRLHVQLTDAITGRQLWSERFDRDVSDLFAVQDDLVRQVAAALPVKLGEAERLRLAQRYTRNLEAYEHFLRGQAALLVRRAPQNRLAREQYWKAVAADPAFSRAYAGLAMTHALDYQQGWAGDGAASLTRALEFAEKARQMTPEMAEAHWVLAFVHVQRRQHDEALRHLDSALRLNPSYADAYALKGGIYTYIGRPTESVPLLHTALRLNPDAGSLYFLLLGRAYYFLGNSELARINLEQTLLRNAENLEARIYLAASHGLARQREAAVWQADEIRMLEPRFSAQHWLASYPLTDAGQRERLLGALQEIGLR